MLPRKQPSAWFLMLTESGFEVDVSDSLNVVIDKLLFSQAESATTQADKNSLWEDSVCAQLRPLGGKSALVLNYFVRTHERYVDKECTCLGSRIQSLNPVLASFNPTGEGLFSFFCSRYAWWMLFQSGLLQTDAHRFLEPRDACALQHCTVEDINVYQQSRPTASYEYPSMWNLSKYRQESCKRRWGVKTSSSW